MKFVILACSFVVLLACNEALGNLGVPELKGDCPWENLPEGGHNTCASYKCSKDKDGKVDLWFKDPCPKLQCIDTPTITAVPADPTKKFPDCCPVIECGKSQFL